MIITQPNFEEKKEKYMKKEKKRDWRDKIIDVISNVIEKE